MSLTSAIFHFLEGTWHFTRRISHYGQMQGTATFRKAPSNGNQLHYREDGQLQSNDGTSMTAFREYNYRLENGVISVYFTDQKLFHTLIFDQTASDHTTITATATHLCECDTYDATYTFKIPNEFFLRYTVKGPKKEFSIETIFQRNVS